MTRGRGHVAVEDMKARIAAGWDLEMLWNRMHAAETGDGYVYDYFPGDAVPPCKSAEDVPGGVP